MHDIKRSVGVLIYFIFYVYTAFSKKVVPKTSHSFFKKSRTKNIKFKLTIYNIEIIYSLNTARVPALQTSLSLTSKTTH